MCNVKVANEKESSSNNNIIRKKEENLLKENKIMKNNQYNKCEGKICSIYGLHFWTCCISLIEYRIHDI